MCMSACVSVATFGRIVHGAAVAMLLSRLQRETAVARPDGLIDLPCNGRCTINAGDHCRHEANFWGSVLSRGLSFRKYFKSGAGLGPRQIDLHSPKTL